MEEGARFGGREGLSGGRRCGGGGGGEEGERGVGWGAFWWRWPLDGRGEEGTHPDTLTPKA